MEGSPHEAFEPGANLERMALYQAAFRESPEGHLGELAANLPFRLGQSARDFIVPFAWDDELDQLASQAIEVIGGMLVGRRPGAQSGAFAVRRGLPPAGQRFVALAAEQDPHLEPSLTTAFWDAAGAPLSEALKRTFLRALEEELALPRRPPLGPLVALASASLALKVKALAPRGMTYERLEKAAGFALFALVEASSLAATSEVRARTWPVDPEPSLHRLRLWHNPLLYFSIRQSALQNDVNPWALSEELVQRWGAKLGRLGEASDGDETQALEQVQADPSLRELASGVGRRARLRRVLLRLLLEHDFGQEEGWSRLRAAWFDNAAADELVSEPKRLSAVPPRCQLPLQPLIGSGSILEDLQAGVKVALAYGLDLRAAEFLDRAQRHLRDERPGQGREELVQRYGAGRIYRLSGDGKALLKQVEQTESGYLFVDLKGFTQRTVRAKEMSVADFLRREFYEPILAAARRLAPTNRGEFRLLNLLGDAAAFAGEIPALVALSAEIRRICAEYGHKLVTLAQSPVGPVAEDPRLVPLSRATAARDPLLLERTLLEGELSRKKALPAEQRWKDLERQVTTRAGQLAQAFQEVRNRLQTASPVERAALQAEMVRISAAQEALVSRAEKAMGRLQGEPEAERAILVLELLTARERSRLEELDRALRAIDDDLSRELAEVERVREEKDAARLEAGVFISHGAAPEEIRIDDPVFGAVRVFIGERLNEAARGTARSGKVLAEVEAELAGAGRFGARSPFSVFVERGSGDELGSDIYNAGQALSSEALDAFLRGTLGERFHFERRLLRDSAPPELRSELSLPEELRLVVSVSTDTPSDVLTFREVGQVRFRGFERSRPCVVYELLAADGLLAKLLMRHCHGKWIPEARADQASLLAGLPKR
ncbi:MAG: hypothetical protein ACYCWW_13660 [Deltaproteobacteria bacterium]